MNRQRAASVGALGIRYYQTGMYETAAEHKPDYLRVSQAERERAEREKHAVPKVRRMTMEDGAAVGGDGAPALFRWGSEKSVLETLSRPNSTA